MPGTDGDMTVISTRPPAPSPALGRGAPPLESGTLLEGEHLGQFLLEKFVGGGGMGVVFRALDTTLNREVAVKVLSRDQSADEETLRRFRNEAQSAARLNHENIARVHYVGEDRGVHYIVFEFIDGVNIRDMVEQRGPLPLAEAVSYTYQIALALEHASQRDVIHRDIKPSNVLVTSDGAAKLVDMGLARLNQVAPNNDLTASGVTLGTFDYISPEQARDPRSADVRSDLYSLGCSFFYMLTGRPPFPDGTVLQKLLQHQGDHPPDPRGGRPELPADITRIVARLLAKNPGQRYQRPSELLDELAGLAEQLGLQLGTSHAMWVAPASAGASARWRQHLPWAVPLAALFLIVVGLDSYWSTDASTGTNLDGAARPTAPRPPTKGVSTGQPAPGNVGEGSAKSAAASALPKIGPPPPAHSAADPRTVPPGPDKPAGPPTTPAEQKRWFDRFADQWTKFDLQRLAQEASQAAAKSGKAGANAPGGAKEDPNATPADSKPAANPPAARENLLIVGDEAGPHSYTSLYAACSIAKHGDVIELRYNGPRRERPLAIANMQLTIRAGANYRPVVVFRPEPADPVTYPSSMLTISGGQLSVANLHFELELARNVSSDWALVETRRAEMTQFKGCSFTIRNASPDLSAYHAGVAFFDVKAPPDVEMMAMDPNAAAEPVVVIELEDCIARGEGNLLRADEQQAVRLNWDNGLLAVSERLLVAAGGPTQPRQAGHIQVNLRHVTARMQNGLAHLTNSQDAPYQLLTEIHCDDCILLSGGKAPLIEQRGSDEIEEYLPRLQWSGDYDYFDGFDIFWQIRSTGIAGGSKQLRFDDWQNAWRGKSRRQAVGKAAVRLASVAPADRALHAHTPSDYALDVDASDNRAIEGGSDGQDAGCLARQLPLLPSSDEAPRAPGVPEKTGSEPARGE